MDESERKRIVEACRDLVIELTHLGDHGEHEKAIALWTEDGTWIRGGKPFTGRAELLASFSRGSGTNFIRHLVTATRVLVQDADNATGVSYYMAISHDPKTETPEFPLPLSPMSMGEWHDRYVRTADGWRFAHREVKRLFQRQGGGH